MCRGENWYQTKRKKLARINIMTKWGHTDWDGKVLYRDWSRHWLFDHGQRDVRIVQKWWRNPLEMSESGHAAWKRVMMNRPHRAEKRRVEKDIVAGRVDPEEAVFPIWGKPFIYYW